MFCLQATQTDNFTDQDPLRMCVIIPLKYPLSWLNHGHYTILVAGEDIENFTSFTRRFKNTQTVDVRPLQVQVLIQSRLELKIFDIAEPGRQPFY